VRAARLALWNTEWPRSAQVGDGSIAEAFELGVLSLDIETVDARKPM
jgi:hypothetical protein